MRTLRSRVGVAVVSKKLYAFGGYDGSARLSTVECFNPQASFYLLCRYILVGQGLFAFLSLLALNIFM